jgi:signal transduction histidine kinase
MMQEAHFVKANSSLAKDKVLKDRGISLAASGGMSAQLSPDDRKVERILATARALLAAFLVTAISLVPDKSEYGYLYRLILPLYCAYSAGVIALYRMRSGTGRVRIAVHVADIVWASALLLMMFSVPPYSMFVVFLIFPMLAAAMRWGFRATMATAAITVAMLFMVNWIAHPQVFSDLQHFQQAEGNTLSIGVASLLILGFLLGYLGEHEKQLRSEATAVARVANQAHKAITPSDTVMAVFGELFGLFEAAQIQLAVHEIPTGRINVWESNRSDTGQIGRLVCRELDFSHRDELLFENNNYCLLGVRSAKADDVAEIRIFDTSGKTIKANPYDLRKGWFPEAFSSFVSVPLVFGSEWEVRLFLWDPPLGKVNRNTVRAVADISGRLGPMIFAAALQQHLSSRATAEERARLARELHDGIMQSLVAMDMKLEVILKKLDASESDPVFKGILSVQQVLRGEVANLRELIQHNRRTEIGPTRLLPFLSETVSRFQREIGITARFICELDEVILPPATCYEVARIVQEALTNVSKHSGASNVIVRFTEHGNKWILVISDDGHGFDFVGHYALSELDAARIGPVVIKERVRSISGDLIIESIPERGARLEITFSKEQE